MRIWQIPFESQAFPGNDVGDNWDIAVNTTTKEARQKINGQWIPMDPAFGSTIDNGDPTVFPEQVMSNDGVLYPTTAQDYFLRSTFADFLTDGVTWNTRLEWDMPGIVATLQGLANTPFTDLGLWLQRSPAALNTPNDVNPLQDPPVYNYQPNSGSGGPGGPAYYGTHPWRPPNGDKPSWETPRNPVWTTISTWENSLPTGGTAPPIGSLPTMYTDTTVPNPAFIYRLVLVFLFPAMSPSIYEIDWNIVSVTRNYTLLASDGGNGMVNLHWTDPYNVDLPAGSSTYQGFTIERSTTPGIWEMLYGPGGSVFNSPYGLGANARDQLVS